MAALSCPSLRRASQKSFCEQELRKGKYVITRLLTEEEKKKWPNLVYEDRLPAYCFKNVQMKVPLPLENDRNSCHTNSLIQFITRIDPVRAAYIRSRWSDTHKLVRRLPSDYRDELSTVDSGERLQIFGYLFHSAMSSITSASTAKEANDSKLQLRTVMRGSDYGSASTSLQCPLDLIERVFSSVETDMCPIARAYRMCMFSYSDAAERLHHRLHLPLLVKSKTFSIQRVLTKPFLSENIISDDPPGHFEELGGFLIISLIYITEEISIEVPALISIQDQKFQVVAAVYADEHSPVRHYVAYVECEKSVYLADDSVISKVEAFPLGRSLRYPILLLLKKAS